MNCLDRIEVATNDRTPDRHGVWFVTVREDDLRALVRLARAALHIGIAFHGITKVVDEFESASAALEEPCEP